MYHAVQHKVGHTPENDTANRYTLIQGDNKNNSRNILLLQQAHHNICPFSIHKLLRPDFD